MEQLESLQVALARARFARELAATQQLPAFGLASLLQSETAAAALLPQLSMGVTAAQLGAGGGAHPLFSSGALLAAAANANANYNAGGGCPAHTAAASVPPALLSSASLSDFGANPSAAFLQKLLAGQLASAAQPQQQLLVPPHQTL